MSGPGRERELAGAWAVVLAAGASRRMGGQASKALCELDGRSFLATIDASARSGGVAGVLVVVGPPHEAQVRAALPDGARWARNPAPERGMLTSVQAGVAALPPSASGALIWPVDIPRVQPATVRALSTAAPDRLVVPTSFPPAAPPGDAEARPRGGHPLYLPRARFAELLALPPEATLRALLDADATRVLRLPVDDPGILHDVDTPADLDALTPRR